MTSPPPPSIILPAGILANNREKLKDLPSSKGDHEMYYAIPSTSKEGQGDSEMKKRPVNAPKLTLALNALWKMKMKNMTGKPQLKNIIKRPPVITKSDDGGTTSVTTTTTKKKMTDEDRAIKSEKSDSNHYSAGSNGDATELLETTASGYAATAAPQYVTDFSGMDYPIQPHIQNGSNSYVYTGDPAYQSYYQYTGNVHSPPSYLLAGGGASPGSGDDNHNDVSHATRACPATIQWLLENYEPSDGTSLPRCTLYDHYKKHCSEFKLDPVNAASFGKLIRNVFQNLRTRRLGTRGNSKYHYYGIRIKPESPLNNINYGSSSSPRSGIKRPATTTVSQSRNSSSSPVTSYSSASTIANTPVTHTKMGCSYTEADKASLGDGDVPQVNFETCGGLDSDLRKLGLDLGHVCRFVENYRYNCNEVLNSVRNLQFEMIEEIWSSFWQPDEIDDEDKALNTDRLNQQQIFSLCTLPQIQQFVINMDISFYQVIVDILVPNVLMSQMTPALTQLCRSFAKHAETYMKNALRGAPEAIQKKKLQAVKYMSQGLRRYTSLNHLAQAAKAVLMKPEQVQAMHNDYIRIDINQVQEQAGWVCGCDPVVIFQIHSAFKDLLTKSASMNDWAEWMESIVDQNVQILSNFHGKPASEIIASGKQFLKHWCFYTSIIIRDLTLRSAGSFGSFHLIRILTDEFMMFLIENRLAKALGRPMIGVVVQQGDHAIFDDLAPTQALPSITLNQSYANAQDPMMYGLQYQYHVINNNENVDIEHHADGVLAEMQPTNNLL